MSRLRACGVLVVRTASAQSWTPTEFLLMRHADRWDLPKGHVDPGEDDLTCALRELEEETGIPADALEIDPDFQFQLQYPVATARTGGETWEKTLVIYLGRLLRPVDVSVSEHEGFRWFPWSPGHRIQLQTIDPLLSAVERHIAG